MNYRGKRTAYAAGSVLATVAGVGEKPFMNSFVASGIARPGSPNLGESCAAKPNNKAKVRST